MFEKRCDLRRCTDWTGSCHPGDDLAAVMADPRVPGRTCPPAGRLPRSTFGRCPLILSIPPFA